MQLCMPTLHRSATALSDYEELQEFPVFCRSAERHFQSLAGPRNVSVDLNYDVVLVSVCVGHTRLSREK